MENKIEENKMENSLDSSQNNIILKQIEDLKKQLPKKIRKPKKLPIAITQAEFEGLLKVTKSDKHKLAYLLGFESGLRVSEVVKLERRDLELAEGKIFIRMGKGSKDRIAPLPKHFMPKYALLLPIGIGIRALQKAFKNSAKDSGLLKIKPTAHFHSLRHGFATHFLEKGGDIQYLKVLMGHTNIATTDIYNQLNPKIALDKVKELW